jgi:uncharacterized surface protein with fasciclin (FAS1) repeats
MNKKSLLMRLKNKYLLVLLASVVGLSACKKWDNHIAVTDQNLNQNLLQALSSNSDFSTFRQFVSKTGLDSVLEASKTYTVWAPNNAALQSLDPAIANDPVKLKNFVLNHISNLSYLTRDVKGSLRIKMLSGKYIGFTTSKFDSANIIASKYVSNGILYTIDKGIVVLPSIWDFINSTTTQYAQNSFIAALNFNDFDPSLATVDSINSTTGQPVYHPGTGIVVKNKFKQQVYDLSREDKQYTYFVVADAGFKLESDSLQKYYATASTTATDTLAKWNTVKDFAVEGVYAANQLAGLVSKSGVPIPVDPSDIIQTIKTSNGVVYVLSKLDVNTADKYPNIIVQGENPDGFLTIKSGNTFYRQRTNPITGKIFSDLMISGHGITGYYAYYDLPETPTMTYQVYALAQNDFQTGAFVQKVVFRDMTQLTQPVITTLTHNVPLAFTGGAVNPAAYNEILLGTLTVTNYGTVEIQLTANSSSTPMVLDYLRLVPQP